MKFAEKLSSLRKANNLSQEQLADKLNVSRQSVSKWESGDTYPDMAKMIQMCEILNCTLPELMDDGTFSEDYKPKEEKNNTVSTYLKSFLDYVTKTYNMFIHMTTKAKLICLIEMLLIGIVISLIVHLFPQLLNAIIDRLFRHIPYGHTISNIISDIIIVLLGIIGVIVFFHLFKIRYLDYYVTITDKTIEKQVVEEPIKENATTSALDSKQKKEKVVIRDPKHSISHFLDGIAKVLLFIFKVFVVMWSIPAIIAFIGATYLATIMFANAMYSSVFTFTGIALLGCCVIGFIFVYMAVNYIFKRKQPARILIVLFLSSLLLIGIGAGCATDKALSLDVVASDYQTNYETKEFLFNKDDVINGYELQFNCYNIERVIDDSVEGVKVIIEMPENTRMTNGEYVSDFEDMGKGTYFNFGYAKGIAQEIYKIKNDIKNGYIRENYEGPHASVKVKVIMSSKIDEVVRIINW